MMRRTRRAGISVPLFSLRSTRGWGIGEIGDISAAAGWLRAAGQSVLQILPLNEMAPGETSPYSALSAMAIDPQFISVWQLDDAEELAKSAAGELAEVCRSPRVDYPKVRRLKARALKTSFERFFETQWQADTTKAARFRAYVAQEQWWLDEYSLYRALRAEAGERSWMEWPALLRDRDAGALAEARARLSKEVLFVQYLQWKAADQLHRVRSDNADVEILGDFPFMVTLDSADVWSRRDDFILDASVGTPPDAFSETGQEWGLPPYNWHEARKNGFEWLRMRARRFADLYDGFRVDHLVGFYRTYIRPRDGQPPYFMPAEEGDQRSLGEETMRIIMETGADVSVEDLGTVPDFVRESIFQLGLPGYKVLRWEPTDSPQYPPLSVAMTGTHDTECLAVWWESLTADEQRRFGVDSARFDSAVRDALLARIYRAGSNLVLLPIQDVFGWRDRINQPATISDANWTFVVPWPVDEIDRQPEARECAARLAALSTETGRANPSLRVED